MRDKYFNFIKENKILDILSEIEEMSYSIKLRILEELSKKYNVQEINYALYYYNKRYIKENRIDLIKLKNTLKYLCKEGKNASIN